MITTEVYYDQDGITVQPATNGDVEWLKTHLRKQDVDEVWDASHYTSTEALYYSLDKTAFCLTVRINGVPCAIFGVNGDSILGYNGTIWMLGTDDIRKIGIRFVRNSRKFIDMMLDLYPKLSNYVSVENTVSIAWLKSLGARFKAPEPYGIEQKNFMYFEFERK